MASSQPYLRRDPALDGLRGIAILLVFLFHYGGGLRAHDPLLRAVGYLSQCGWIGVNVFFALSGFLITDILTASTFLFAPQQPNPGFTPGPPLAFRLHALRHFYYRRALRILPLYFVALLACAVAALLLGAHLRQLSPLLIYALFLQNLPSLVNPALQTPPPLPIFHLWSLAVEAQFYLLWPFVLLAARTPRRALAVSLWVFALTAVARALLFNPHILPFQTAQTCATFLPFRAGALTLGAALALYRREHAASPGSQAPRNERFSPLQAISEGASFSQTHLFLAATAALCLFVFAASLSRTFLLNSPLAYTFTLPAADLLVAALVALSLQANLLRRALSHPFLIFLGRVSYGFYVFHILLEPLFDHLGAFITHTHTGFAYQAARLLVALPLTAAAAWFSFTLIERPFLRLGRRFPSQTARIQAA